MSIKTIEKLRKYLQYAIELEHATIPTYLSALYTIKPNTNQEAYYIIRSVMMEEMLHMTLAANVLNAVGGDPSINHPTFIPEYPTHLPYSDDTVLVRLMSFAPDSVRMFLDIERPGEWTEEQEETDTYHSIGAFYKAIQDGLEYLVKEHGEERVFCGDPNRQITSLMYGSGGGPIKVTCLAEARRALEEIIDQGEGLPHSIFDGDHKVFQQDAEVAHYYRFNQLLLGRKYQDGDTINSGPTGEEFTVDWEQVYKTHPDPKTADYPEGSELRAASQAFNETYMRLLNVLHDAFNGDPDKLETAVAYMMELKYKAQEIFKNPYPGKEGYHAGPTFEYVDLKKL